ncbi:MAG TPA: fused MFS/spermidine synthase [Myxococcota bacterium]
MPSVAAEHRASEGIAVLFAFAIFAGAFLIFQVQPMVGKYILPWFGGTPGVWSLCLAFYQATLFLGYAYAHLLIRHVPPLRQPAVHALLLLAALATLPVLPEASWKPEGGESPGLRILGMLAANVGLPFLLLAATGPLVQAWFARVFPARSPYPLYAVSNAGSLLALLSYPVAVEPVLALPVQSFLWSGAFIACALAVMACAWLATRARPERTAGGENASPRPQPARTATGDALLWVALPCCAVVLLMGVTNELCLNLASAPFLWIIPLSVYLLTFILCFASAGLYRRGAFALLAGTTLLLLLRQQGWTLTPDSDTSGGMPVLRHIVHYAVLLFACCSLMHGELYRLRPHPRQLTAYYLCIAGGGALGGLFVGIAAPALFSDYYELGGGIAACWGLLALCIGRGARPESPGARSRAGWGAFAALALAGVALVCLGGNDTSAELAFKRRNFFGVLRVLEKNRNRPAQHYFMLNSGTTTHGVQYRDAMLRSQPTTYFGSATGVGYALQQRRPGERTRVGIIGLGIGTLSAYGREGDRFRYYEIDPDVVAIAGDTRYFSYLADSRAGTEVVLGDARLSLESELRDAAPQAFDLLVLDAFTSDAIPVHLLTAEALDLYERHLAKGGAILAHVSNRRVELAPLLFGQAVRRGMRSLEIVNRPVLAERSSTSRWIVLCRDEAYIAELVEFIQTQQRALQLPPNAVVLRRPDEPSFRGYPIWTDAYSNLFGVLRARQAPRAEAPSEEGYTALDPGA